MNAADASTRTPPRGRRAWVPHLVLAVVGLLVALYPFTLAQALPVTCRGVVMGPRDVCFKANGQQQQTYEQRVATAREAAPVIVGVGVLVAAFGTGLAVSGYRRTRS